MMSLDLCFYNNSCILITLGKEKINSIFANKLEKQSLKDIYET